MTTTLRTAELDTADNPSRVWLDTSFVALAADEDKPKRRRLSGTFAPYGVEIDRLNWRLGTTKFRIEPAALTVQDNAKAFYGHDWQTGGMPIGRIAASKSEAEALTGDVDLSATAKATEVYALAQDGTLDRFSVGFDINEYRVEDADSDAPVLVVTAGEVFEVSVVPYPAYDDAAVKSVNSRPTPERNPVTTPTITPEAPEVFSAADGRTLSEAVEQLSRQVATLDTTLGADVPASVPFSSYGEFVKAMLNGNHERHAEAEALAVSLAYGDAAGDGVSAETTYRDTWVGDTIRLISQPRKVWNLFESAPLPAEGMGVEYGVLESNTVDVARQVNEGDPLVMGKITVGTATADVLTFGGASKQSFQQAQRSNVNVLDLTWRALAIMYGRVTELYLRGVLADPLQVAPHEIGTVAALTDPDAWISWLVDVALYFDEQKGLSGEYLRLTPDVYKSLATMRLGTDGPFLLDRSTGSVNLTELTGNVSGLPIRLTPGAGLVEVGHSTAIRTFESSGAPTRLGPEQDILTLTQAVGVYGFNAVAVQDEKAIVRAGTGV